MFSRLHTLPNHLYAPPTHLLLLSDTESSLSPHLLPLHMDTYNSAIYISLIQRIIPSKTLGNPPPPHALLGRPRVSRQHNDDKLSFCVVVRRQRLFHGSTDPPPEFALQLLPLPPPQHTVPVHPPSIRPFFRPPNPIPLGPNYIVSPPTSSSHFRAHDDYDEELIPPTRHNVTLRVGFYEPIHLSPVLVVSLARWVRDILTQFIFNLLPWCGRCTRRRL